MECPQCGTNNGKNSKFCISCEKELKIYKFCQKCGEKNIEGANFCQNCGTTLETISQKFRN